MHECYAMQILETKKTKIKEQWSQRIGVKHKDQESQDRLRTQNHTNYFTSIKRFGKDVSILSFNRDILKTHNLSFNKIPNEVIPNLYVLSLRMLNRVLRYINSTRVITVNNYGILGYPIIS